MAHHKTGFLVDVRVEKTKDKGLGVFARAPIKKGSVVWRHLPGVFTVYDEQSFRSLIAPMSPEEIVFELTHVHTFDDFPGTLIRARDDGIYINHSRTPNIFTNNMSPAEPTLDAAAPDYLQNVAAALMSDRFSLLAARDIEPGEELVNDYNEDDDGPEFYDALCEWYGVDESYLG